METKSKIQRLKAWLCRKLCGEDTAAEPEITRIENTNIERFMFDGLQVEAEVFSDRIIYTVSAGSHRVLKGWVYHTSEGLFNIDHAISFHPNLRLRRRLKEYATQRLNELAKQQSKDLQ